MLNHAPASIRKRVSLCLLVLALFCTCVPLSAAVGGEDVILGGRDATGQNGVIATGRAECTEIGLEILKQGGNAVDAAVAVGFALGVCEQQSSGIGGGGFMTLRLATGETFFLDFRDRSGAAASLDMWEVNPDGSVLNQENKIGGKAVAVPGDVKGLLYALETYGTMDREAVMAPAIQMAEEGFVVSHITSRDIKDAYRAIIRYDSTMAIYLDEDGMPRGEIAEKIVSAVQADGGCLTLEDFANYTINVTEPVHGTYRGYDIYSSNLPSSGGTIIVEMLNILEHFDVSALDPESPAYFHLLSEVMKLCYADRARYMGDPEYVDVPVAGLTNKAYAKAQAARIDLNRSQTYEAADPWPFESDSTTSYAILDAAGNMVAVTKTVDATFASGLVAEGTGILLNDTLFDFSTDPLSPNVVAGNKRPLSSMSPTLVLKDGQPVLVLGAPGATRIISGVLQVITKIIDHGMDVQAAIDAVRMHDDFGIFIIERRVDETVLEALRAMGHKVNASEVWFTFPCVQAVQRLDDGTLRGAADPRRDGKAAAY